MRGVIHAHIGPTTHADADFLPCSGKMVGDRRQLVGKRRPVGDVGNVAVARQQAYGAVELFAEDVGVALRVDGETSSSGVTHSRPKVGPK